MTINKYMPELEIDLLLLLLLRTFKGRKLKRRSRRSIRRNRGKEGWREKIEKKK